MNHVAIPRKCFYLCVRCKYRLLFMHELFVFALAVILIFGQWTRFDGGTEIASIVSNFAAQIKTAKHKHETNVTAYARCPHGHGACNYIPAEDVWTFTHWQSCCIGNWWFNKRRKMIFFIVCFGASVAVDAFVGGKCQVHAVAKTTIECAILFTKPK